MFMTFLPHVQPSIRLPASVRSGCDAVYLRVEHKKTRDPWLTAEAFLQRNAERIFELRNQRPCWQLSNYTGDFSTLWPAVPHPQASTGKNVSFPFRFSGIPRQSGFSAAPTDEIACWVLGLVEWWGVCCITPVTPRWMSDTLNGTWGRCSAPSEGSLNETWVEFNGKWTKHEQREGGFEVEFLDCETICVFKTLKTSSCLRLFLFEKNGGMKICNPDPMPPQSSQQKQSRTPTCGNQNQNFTFKTPTQSARGLFLSLWRTLPNRQTKKQTNKRRTTPNSLKLCS